MQLLNINMITSIGFASAGHFPCVRTNNATLTKKCNLKKKFYLYKRGGNSPAELVGSWSEPIYAEAWGNACWELYGIAEAANYPSSGMTFTWTVTADVPGSIKWSDWSARSATCPGHPHQNISWTNTPQQQVVTWKIYYDDEQPELRE